MQRTILALENTAEHRKQEERDLSRQIRALQQQNEQLATQIEEEMKWKVKADELESVSAMAELQTKHQQEDVARERARLLRELEGAGKELAEVRQQLLACESSLQKETESRSRLHSEWRQSEMEAAQLKDQLARRAAEGDQLRAVLNETVSQGGLKAHLSSEVTEMRARIAAMAERLARTEEEAAKAKIQEATTHSKSEELKRDISTLRETSTSYKLEIHDCHARLTYRATEVESLQSQVRTLQAENQKLERASEMSLKSNEEGSSQVQAHAHTPFPPMFFLLHGCVVLCCVVWCVVWCGVVLCGVVRCGVLCCIVLC